jgi:hypothetical protein
MLCSLVDLSDMGLDNQMLMLLYLDYLMLVCVVIWSGLIDDFWIYYYSIFFYCFYYDWFICMLTCVVKCFVFVALNLGFCCIHFV